MVLISQEPVYVMRFHLSLENASLGFQMLMCVLQNVANLAVPVFLCIHLVSFFIHNLVVRRVYINIFIYVMGVGQKYGSCFCWIKNPTLWSCKVARPTFTGQPSFISDFKYVHGWWVLCLSPGLSGFLKGSHNKMLYQGPLVHLEVMASCSSEVCSFSKALLNILLYSMMQCSGDGGGRQGRAGGKVEGKEGGKTWGQKTGEWNMAFIFQLLVQALGIYFLIKLQG